MRIVLFILGLSTLVVVWLGPLHTFLPGPFSGHMTMHMGVVSVAAPLLALSLADGRLDPVRKMPLVFAPIPASIIEGVIVWAWHAPALHHVARHSTDGLLIEQSTFLCSGLLMWLSACGAGARRGGNRTAAGVVALLLTSMHMTLLGALLALSPRPLYAHAIEGVLSPLEDQHLGGAIMLVAGGVSYLAGGLWLGLALLKRDRSAA